MDKNLIKVLFLDVGGVLMTNGWDHVLRTKVSQVFDIEQDEMNIRHALLFDSFERGRLSFDDYLTNVIFFRERKCTLQEVKDYIFNSVRPFQDMIDYIKKFKQSHGIRVAIVSNEGRELAEDRIKRFDLSSFVDFFIVSSFVHYRKPDLEIYHMAIDIAQVLPHEIVYIDDRRLLVEVAHSLGIHAIWHENIISTRKQLEQIF